MRYYEIVARKIIRCLRYRDVQAIGDSDTKVQYWIGVYSVPTTSLKRQVYYQVMKECFPNTPNKVIDEFLNHAYPKTKEEREAEKDSQAQTSIT